MLCDGRCGLADGVVSLALRLLVEQLPANREGQRQRGDEHADGAAELFVRQQFAAFDVLVRRQFPSCPRADQLTKNDKVIIAEKIAPPATFPVITSQFILGFEGMIFCGIGFETVESLGFPRRNDRLEAYPTDLCTTSSRKQSSISQRPNATRTVFRGVQPSRLGTRFVRKYFTSSVNTLRA